MADENREPPRSHRTRAVNVVAPTDNTKDATTTRWTTKHIAATHVMLKA